MDELIRKQTVLNMIDDVQFGNITNKLSQLHEAVRNLPSVDSVEVVRCYKCIHWDKDTVRRNSNDATWWNEAVCRKYSDDIWDAWKEADWFCADGERRNDDGFNQETGCD